MAKLKNQLTNQHFTLLKKEGMENVMRKVNSSNPYLFITECVVTLRDEKRKLTKEYPVYKDKGNRFFVDVWIEDRGIVALFLDEFKYAI